jgi:site-specific DNA-cytosine methylase
MKVLIACESSGKVREAFRKLGHDAWSNDILPADDGSEFHIQGDCVEAIQNGLELETYNSVEFCDLSLLDKENANDGIIKKDRASWDLIIMHPPCTALCVSGNRWYGSGMTKHQDRIDSIKWTIDLFELAKSCASMVAMENPVGVIPIKASQYIQPWQFGHGETKKTGLWLHNLPLLTPTDIVEGREDRIHKMPPSADRWKKRSETYQGIADAMAAQWGILE